jgi:hypothetical protein
MDSRFAGHMERAWARLSLALLWGLASITTLWGAVAVWHYGWRDLYADQWRLYETLIRLPFPENVLRLENGHRPVLPSLLRLAELEYAGGSQTWQLGVGLLFALAAVLGIWWLLLRESRLTPASRALAALVAALGVFWLGNARMLMHPNEAVSTYPIIAIAVLVAGLLARQLRRSDGGLDPLATVGIGLGGLLATFTFGPGIGILAAAGIVLLAARARPLVVAMPWLMMLAVLAVYLLLPGADGVRGMSTLRPLDNLLVAWQWLGAPALHLLRPLLDPGAAHWYAGELFDPQAAQIAAALAPRHGPFDRALWPALLGAAGSLYIGWQTLRTWLARRQLNDVEVLGLLIAWFGLGTAAIVAVTRLGYFDLHPGQIYAGRYLPWSSLFWAGVGLTVVGRARRLRPAATLVILLVVLLALGLNGTQSTWSKHVQQIARTSNVALAAGVFPQGLTLGESVEAEILAGLAAVTRAGIGIHGHPAARAVGSTLDPLPPLLGQAVGTHWTPLADRRGGDGYRVAFRVPDGYPSRRGQLWLLAAPDGRVIGLAHAEPGASRIRMRGYATPADGPIAAFAWAVDGPGAGLELGAQSGSAVRPQSPPVGAAEETDTGS